ncbi:hypothetical protein ACFQL4_09190 [Halosimplex aquaticum]
MAWVDSEYAGELAVVSAWLSALLPWSLTVLSPSQSSESFTFVIIRYTYFQFQFLLGSNLAVESFLWIADLPGFVTPQVRSAAWAAVAAAALFALPLGFSIAYYLAEERVEGSRSTQSGSWADSSPRPRWSTGSPPRSSGSTRPA